MKTSFLGAGFATELVLKLSAWGRTSLSPDFDGPSQTRAIWGKFKARLLKSEVTPLATTEDLELFANREEGESMAACRYCFKRDKGQEDLSLGIWGRWYHHSCRERWRAVRRARSWRRLLRAIRWLASL